VLDLKNWTADDFTNIKDIGPVVAENVAPFSTIRKTSRLLEDHGKSWGEPDPNRRRPPQSRCCRCAAARQNGAFYRNFAKMGRKEAQEKAEAAGARLISAVSSKLDILVVGEDAGSKLKKARELGTVQILTEEEFVDLMLDV
jgi:DNA ligase (NAD+)